MITVCVIAFVLCHATKLHAFKSVTIDFRIAGVMLLASQTACNNNFYGINFKVFLMRCRSISLAFEKRTNFHTFRLNTIARLSLDIILDSSVKTNMKGV